MVEQIAEPGIDTEYEEAAGPGPETALSAPGEEAVGTSGRIVVGVDGSDPSLAALRWAGRQATLTGAALEAVIAWELPAAYGLAGGLSGLPGDFDLEATAAEILSDAVAAALPPEQAAKVTRRTVLGNPAQVILDYSDGAELIVVGVRGHGTFRSTLLGSVSHAVTLHAKCPVVVVRETAEQSAG